MIAHPVGFTSLVPTALHSIRTLGLLKRAMLFRVALQMSDSSARSLRGLYGFVECKVSTSTNDAEKCAPRTCSHP
jgi:hypothetical protein